MRKHIKKTVHITFGGLAVIVGLLVISGIIEYLLIKGSTINPGVNAPDVANMTYDINGAVFNLQDGVNIDQYTSGPAVKNKLSVFGDPVYSDFDKDRDIDAATILVDETGTNGNYYYGVLVLNDEGSFHPTNVIYLGSNISAPVAKVIDGHIVYSYTTMTGSESSSSDSVFKKSLWVKYDKTINQISEFIDMEPR